MSHPDRPTIVLVKMIERSFRDSDLSSVSSLSDSEELEDEKPPPLQTVPDAIEIVSAQSVPTESAVAPPGKYFRRKYFTIGCRKEYSNHINVTDLVDTGQDH